LSLGAVPVVEADGSLPGFPMRTFLPFLLAAALLLSLPAFGQISKEREIDEDAMKKADFRLLALGYSYTFYWDVPG
jgi:hypothetical protein